MPETEADQLVAAPLGGRFVVTEFEALIAGQDEQRPRRVAAIERTVDVGPFLLDRMSLDLYFA